MPNPAMRAAREVKPVFTTDSDGNRVGDRPRVGPAPPEAVHAALKAQDALAKAPRPAPVATDSPGAVPADTTDNPTRDLRVSTAAQRLSSYGNKLDNAINDQSQ